MKITCRLQWKLSKVSSIEMSFFISANWSWNWSLSSCSCDKYFIWRKKYFQLLQVMLFSTAYNTAMHILKLDVKKKVYEGKIIDKRLWTFIQTATRRWNVANNRRWPFCKLPESIELNLTSLVHSFMFCFWCWVAHTTK